MTTQISNYLSIPSVEERLKQIIDTSYKLLCNKIVSGNIAVDNEASLQMQLGVLLKQIGQLYEFGKNDHFTVDLETLCDNDTDLKKFVEENKVPSSKIKFFMEDECRYSFTINDVPYREFDFEVFDEIANKHVDDYEISKDEMYDMYNSADYYDGDDYSESITDFDE